MSESDITVIGGGLAGSEAALQIAEQGLSVDLYEMRPHVTTGAHQTDGLGELVCSNSFGSILPDRASGMLKEEMSLLNSQLLKLAFKSKVPAGNALAVDRIVFSEEITQAIHTHPHIKLIREEVTEIPQDKVVVIASGPLTSSALSASIKQITGKDYLYFYDALAPIVERESIDDSIAFRASRREEEAVGDYLNCPLNKEEYQIFHQALLKAPRIELRDFENEDDLFFESCLPIEILATRGEDALRFGPMRPVGLTDPRTGRWPYAALQLRQDNIAGSLYNLVGFQTNIKWGEQEEVLRLVPGLKHAEFIRMGQMHRNTFLNSPTLLEPTMQFKKASNLFFAGQITGIEGYMGNVASGLVAGLNAARYLKQKDLICFPQETMIGSLCWYVTHAEAKHFQPMKANFGIIPPLEKKIRNKRERLAKLAERGIHCMKSLIAS